jgi:hypothetical protein
MRDIPSSFKAEDIITLSDRTPICYIGVSHGAPPQLEAYLKLSLVSCPILLYPAASSSERVAFRQVNRKTGNRLKQQLVDAETGVTTSRSKARARLKLTALCRELRSINDTSTRPTTLCRTAGSE